LTLLTLYSVFVMYTLSSFILFSSFRFLFFFFNATPTTEIYTLSLHDALPISPHRDHRAARRGRALGRQRGHAGRDRRRPPVPVRSEEHTSELQSPCNLVCRLLLEKKKKKKKKKIKNNK